MLLLVINTLPRNKKVKRRDLPLLCLSRSKRLSFVVGCLFVQNVQRGLFRLLLLSLSTFNVIVLEMESHSFLSLSGQPKVFITLCFMVSLFHSCCFLVHLLFST